MEVTVSSTLHLAHQMLSLCLAMGPCLSIAKYACFAPCGSESFYENVLIWIAAINQFVP